MTANVLFLGATGHIGAAVLQALKAIFPELPVSAIVTSKGHFQSLSDTYRENFFIIKGSLGEYNLLVTEASKTCLVINCAPVPYTEGIAALFRGLASGSSPTTPVFYIHTSGAARIWDPPNGDVEGRVWDDVATAASSSSGEHTAIISPGFVVGRSPSRTHAVPITFPDWMHVVRTVGGPFTVASGRNVTSFVDTEALAGLYVRLAEDALRYIAGEGGGIAAPDENVWGPRAYYFASTLEVPMREFNDRYLIPALKKTAAGAWLKKETTTELSVEEVYQIVMGRFDDGVEAGIWSRHIAEAFGTSTRIRPTRPSKYLGFHLGGLDAAVAAALRETGS